ncbi:UDP-glucose/GDP-mannose dehydrogenase family protein [Patescibacteria group bacterium]|nr:UDP-glucose/GDP-mannose dehydrogenase family protein [Patescibacteria group bacterium]
MAQIIVVGSGVIGQATGRAFLSMSNKVTFVDIDEERLGQLRDEGHQALHLKNMDLKGVDVVFVTVSTPTVNGRMKSDNLTSAITAIGKALKKVLTPKNYPLVVIRSTVLPGTIDGKVIPLLEKTSGGKAGRDFGICVNPEYLREAQAGKDSAKPWITVIGENEQKSGEILEELYKPLGSPIHKVPIMLAEFQKYVHNLFNSAKISFFNEMRMVSEMLGVDAERAFQLVVDSAEGMWHPAYGTRNLGPFRGSCLPKDTQAFLNYAREMGIEMPLLEATIEVNKKMKSEKAKKNKPFS